MLLNRITNLENDILDERSRSKSKENELINDENNITRNTKTQNETFNERNNSNSEISKFLNNT
jgi:hypothetical protein